MDARRAALERDPVLRARAVDADGTDRGRYLAGDAAGRGGVEESCESWLRGLRGLTTENLETGEVTRTSFRPAAIITSASLTFAQQMPTAPSSICRRAMIGHL